MKKVLSDYIKSKEDFDRFCNLFLKREVSRCVKVYDAPGPDGGIDADYSGTYDGKCGRWVFQYKFFDPTMDKGRVRSSLISQMKGSTRKKGELDKAAELQCDHYVLMTNTWPTPGTTSKIEAAKREKGYTFSLEHWNAEDLITMTANKFPYLLNSFRDPHLPVFLPWEDMFQNQIARRNRLLRYDYETFGREDEINQFQTFVQDPEKRLSIVYGSGGIGKTQLAIEFAKTIERDHSDYEPLFVQMAGDSFESALADIPPNRNYLFFVDDAHDWIDHLGGVNHLGRIKILLNSPEYRESKAVLITRKPFKSALKDPFLAALPDNAIDEREIKKLSLEKTKAFIRTYTHLADTAMLAGLAQIGWDTPLMAVMVIDLFNKGDDLADLTEDELIERTFESYLNEVFEKYPESSERRRELLEWLSGITPIDIEDKRIRDKLAEILEVKAYKIERDRDQLKTDGLLLQFGRKQRVFPDALSDYVLRKACYLSDGRPSSFHESLLKEFLPLFPVKVIINLARVENIAGEKSLLDEHVTSLKTQTQEGDNFDRMDILEQMGGISYFRPEDAAEIFKIILGNPKEDAVKTYTGWTSTRTHQDVVKQIAKEAQKTVNTLPGFRKTLEIVRELLLMKDLDLPNHDSPQELLKRMAGFQTNKPSAFQMEVLEVFEEWKTADNPELSLALLNALDSLLVLDFCETFSAGSSLKFGWHRLKYTPELTHLRAKAIDLIEQCLKKSQRSIIRAVAINSISQAINPLVSPFRQGIEEEEQAQLREEQARLFNILAEHIAKETNFTVLNAIDQCLDGYAENMELAGFPQERATELHATFRKHENYERSYFYRQFTGNFRDWELSESPEQTQAFLEKYLKKYTPAQLSNLMQACIKDAEKDKEYRRPTDGIWTETGWDPGASTPLLRHIGELDPCYGDTLLDSILAWEADKSICASGLLQCASGLLRGIRCADKDKAQEVTQRLLNQGGVFAKRIVAKRIVAKSYWREDKQSFDQEDLQILGGLSETSDERLQADIAESLQNFYSVDADTVLEILVRFSTDESQTVMRQVIRALTNKELKFSPQKHLEPYKQVMLNCVHLERIDHNAERVLHAIFKHDPSWVIEFFEKRLVYKEKESKRYDSMSDRPSEVLKFDAVPHRPHYLFEDVDWSEPNMLAALKRVRDWVLKSSNLLRFEAPRLLTFMVGGNGPRGANIKINESMRRLFEEWIHSEDLERMQETAYLMRGFAPDAVFYALAELVLIKSKGDKEVQDGITIALISGVHSKNIGDPAPHLVKRISDLETLRDKTESRIVAKFAEDVIKMTEQDIERQTQEDEEFLEGEGW